MYFLQKAHGSTKACGEYDKKHVRDDAINVCLCETTTHSSQKKIRT